MECCRDGCPFGRFSHLHRRTLELCQRDHRVLGHIPDQHPSSPIAGRPALERVLVVPNIFHLRMTEATVFLGTFNAAAIFGILTQCCASTKILSELYRQFLRPHGLIFALTCNVNCGTLYRQVCAFPNHVQSTEFTTGGFQSSCRNISRMINGNRMHLSSISSLMAKGLNTHVNEVFLFSLCIVCILMR